LAPDKPIDFGLQDFCSACRICARACPSKAISVGDRVMYNGYETWKLDTQRCATFNFTKKRGTICNTCVKSCPWTRPPTWPNELVRSLVTHSRVAQRVAIKGAYLLELGNRRSGEEWWFDVAYVDGRIETRGRNETAASDPRQF
jgi:epoxyqueuosine reductase QueG